MVELWKKLAEANKLGFTGRVPACMLRSGRWKVCRAILLNTLAVVAYVLSSAAATLNGSQTLNANISHLTVVSVPPSVTLMAAGSVFASGYSASLTVNYRVRTTPGGSGAITLKAAGDFTPSGGPSVVAPPSAGDELSYTCAGATYGTACGGKQTISTVSSTPVVYFGSSSCTGGGLNGCSASDPNSETIVFNLTNDPRYSTGSYQITIIFTSSAI